MLQRRKQRNQAVPKCPLCRCALRETTFRCTSTDCPFLMDTSKVKLREVICDQKCLACDDDFCGLEKEHPGKHECVKCEGDCNLTREGERAAGDVGYVTAEESDDSQIGRAHV